MATFLYRLGRFSYRRRRLVLMLWIAVLAVVGIGAATVSSSSADTFAVPGTQSQRAVDLLKAEFPQVSADGATARVVFEAPDGQTLTSAANKAEVESLVGELKSAFQVASVADPYEGATVSEDGTALAPGLQLAVYRVVQEALTNALKHAGPDTTVHVTVTSDAAAVRLVVEDTGPPRTPPRPAAREPEGGQGLVGMRERAALYGGTLTAGPNSRGGWTVRAQFLLATPPATEKRLA
ncbi:ATP-binding protein [Streptomyces sp. NPDC088747]|uniref:ATP-binding protein n=1 Tax=Streptomyces sp. NPDC088747 TaxID=3365886 RepID=UPI0037FD1524